MENERTARASGGRSGDEETAIRRFAEGVQAARAAGLDWSGTMDLFARVLVTVEDMTALAKNGRVLVHPDVDDLVAIVGEPLSVG